MQFKRLRFHTGIAFYPLFLAVFICSFLSAHAQSDADKLLDLSANKLPLKEVLGQLEEQTVFTFVYSSTLISLDRLVEFDPYRNISVSEILYQVENQTALKFDIKGRQISIVPLGYGQLSGTITDQGKQPLEYASILVLGEGIGLSTSSDGSFYLSRVPEGNKELEIRMVGYLPQTIRVNVQKDRDIKLGSIVLEDDIRQLDQIEVSDRTASNVNIFAEKETAYVARMPLANLENPQVYNVITGKLIKEQVTFAIQDAIRNAPGAVPVINPSGGLSTFFRGFGIGVNSRNGMETSSERSALDIANLERIEVLKGPSATLFGASVSSFGGLVNLVTKKPEEDSHTEISYTTGSFGLNRLSADINTPLNKDKSVLFRLNTALHKQQSFLDYGFNSTFLLAPSLTYQATDRLKLLVDLEYLKANNTQPMNFIINSPDILQPEDIALDYRATLYHENADVKNYSTRFFAQSEYRLSDTFHSTTLFSHVSENVDYSYQRPVIWTSPTTAMRAAGIYGPVYNGYTNLQQNFNGSLTTGSVVHKLLVGANFRHFSGKFLFSESRVIDSIDLREGFSPLTRQQIDQDAVFIDNPTADQKTTSLYATDVVELGRKLSLMLALRVDHFDRDPLEELDDDGFSQTSLAPKLGAVYQFVPEKISIFVNYMSGFQNVAPALQPDGSRLTLDPLFANQAEAGVKLELLDKKLSFTGSYYNIRIDNATRIDENLFTVQDGEQESKGVDLELIAEPITGLNILAGYAYNDNRIIRASDESIEGNKAANAPENVANIWVSYTLQQALKGVGFGFGANWVDQIYRSTANTFFIPEYTLFNAAVHYNAEKWRIQIKANNLTDIRYWDHYGNAQAPANFAANFSLRF